MYLPGNKLFENDCLEAMKDIPDQSIGMILSDLPYGTTKNKWDSVIPLDKLWIQYKRIIKPRGVIALTSQGIFTAHLMLSNEPWFRYKFVWIKSKSTNFLNARRQPLRRHEDICIFYANQPNYRPIMRKAKPYDRGTRKDQSTGSYNDFKPVRVKSEGYRYPTDTLYCKTAESEAGGVTWHPTQKPVALGRYLIRMFADPNDIILDNAFGSGSFLIAAALENRQYIGIEKNRDIRRFKNEKIDCMNIARNRLAQIEQTHKKDKQNVLNKGIITPEFETKKHHNQGFIDVDQILAETSN